jgi:peroxiredoxin
VPAGTYQVTIMAFKDGGPTRGAMEPLAMGTTEFTIPEIPGGRSDDPFDAGKIDVKVMHNPQPGDVAPEFSAKTLDDKPIKLSDYRGKHVAVYFWVSMGWDLQAKKTNEILKKLYEEYGGGGKDGKLEVVGLNLDQTPEAAKKYVAKHAIPWPIAYLGDWSKTTVPSDWGLRSEGVFLVGPDGKLVARDLQGDAIRTTIEGAMKK